jgi:hypothetical protein
MAIVNELVTNFGFSGNLKPLQDFNTSLSTALPRVSALRVAGAAAGIAIATIGVAKKLNPLTQFIALTGESVQALQALEIASVKFGASSASAFDAFQSLSKQIADARVSGNTTFAKFGISITKAGGELKKASDIMKDLNALFNSSNRLYGKWGDTTVKITALQALGIKQDLLPLLMKTTAEYEKQMSVVSKYALTSEQAMDIKALNDELARTGAILNKMLEKRVAELSPLITTFLKLARGDFEFKKNDALEKSVKAFIPKSALDDKGKIKTLKTPLENSFAKWGSDIFDGISGFFSSKKSVENAKIKPAFGAMQKSEQRNITINSTNNNQIDIKSTTPADVANEVKNAVQSKESDIIQRLSGAGGL